MYRLTLTERYALQETARFLPKSAVAWVFGSRCDVHAKGGDVDLLVRIDASESDRFSLSVRLSLEYQRHCEEKIDVVVLPDRDLSSEDQQFLSEAKLIPLDTILDAPVLDHVALIAPDLKGARNRARAWGFPLSSETNFPREGTREFYVGEEGRANRLLVIQPIAPGPYERALTKRGPGLHHLGLHVRSRRRFARLVQEFGWQIFENRDNREADFYFQRGIGTSLEVLEKPLSKPPALEPVVTKIDILCQADHQGALFGLVIPEIYPATQSRVTIGCDTFQASALVDVDKAATAE